MNNIPISAHVREERVLKRLSLTENEIQKILLDPTKIVLLGFDITRHTRHYLFYSPKDGECFIALIGIRNTLVSVWLQEYEYQFWIPPQAIRHLSGQDDEGVRDLKSKVDRYTFAVKMYNYRTTNYRVLYLPIDRKKQVRWKLSSRGLEFNYNIHTELRNFISTNAWAHERLDGIWLKLKKPDPLILFKLPQA